MNLHSPVFPELIRTKLHPPPVTSPVVMRPRLVSQLDDSLHVPLTLICTPAGFGKTTLLCTWFEQLHSGADGTPIQTAWVSLDEGDNDLQVFLRYVVTAIDQAYPGACRATIELLRAPLPPHANLLTSAFINDLENLAGPLLLVLEDYHDVDSEPVHELLRTMCRHWPGQLHLILTSRSDPPLPLARLRAQNFVRDLRTRDLRFSAAEASDYLATNLTVPLSEGALNQLYACTEGWIAGLHLAALSVATADDHEGAVEQLAGTDDYIARYLMDEVLSRQPAEIQTFLLATSLLERFSADLAKAVLGEPYSGLSVNSAIEHLERAHLFVSPLERTHTWYRYHSLFRQLLSQRLKIEHSEGDVRAMHRRAAEWLGPRGHTDEALRHALSANDPELAAGIIEASLRTALNREDQATLTRWLELLPLELIEARPNLLTIRAWSLQFSWQLAAQGKALRQIEALLATAPAPADEPAYIRPLLGVLNGQAAYLEGRPEEALALCLESLQALPHDWSYARGGAAIYLGLAMQACGRSAEAEPLLTQLHAESRDNSDGYALRILISLCFIHYLGGEFDRLQQTALLLIERASETTLATLSCWGHYFLGAVHYAQNHLEEAAGHFAVAIEHRFSAQALTSRASFVGLALTRLAQDNVSESFAVLARLCEFDLTTLTTESNEARSLRARLQLTSGHAASAAHWADAFLLPHTMQPLLWLEEPRLTWARILITLHEPGDAEAALEYLDDLLAYALRTHNRLFQTRLLILRGWALSATTPPRTSEAVAEIGRAVELAAPANFMQPFLEAGKPIFGLLSQLAGHSSANAFIGRILAESATRRAVPEPPSARGKPAPVELLTAREHDVLQLMRQRLTDKEIAQRLNISVQTAKRHAANIYVKLGVSRRWDAVSLAEAEGILPPGDPH